MATDISELERDAIDDGVKVSRLLRHTGPGSYVMGPPIWGTLPRMSLVSIKPAAKSLLMT